MAGPTRDGVAVGVELPEPWPAALKRVWQTEIGLGHSSPVVAGGKVVQLARRGDDEVLACLRAADGKVLWRSACPAGAFKPRGVARYHGKGPFATPTIAEGRVYALGISGVLTCHDLGSGKQLWRKTFAEEYEQAYPIWGAANSPLLLGDLCILCVGSHRAGALAAFNRHTGQLAWKLADDGAAYASPQAATLAGKPQLVTLTHSRVVGVEPATGKLLWAVPFKVRYEMNIITPILHNDLVVWSGCYEPARAVRIASDDGALAATKLWQNDAESMFMSSPVRHGDHIYGLATRGKGTLVCIALGDGKTVWSSPGGMGKYASLVRVADRLLVLTTKGDLLLLAADPSGYNELGRCHLTDRPVWAHLAVAGRRLYVKDKTHLACFELAGE